MKHKLKLYSLSLLGSLITYTILRVTFYLFGLETVYLGSFLFGGLCFMFSMAVDNAIKEKLN